MIASYQVVTGGFSILSLITGRSREAAGESELSAIIDCVQTFVHSLALLAGLKGLVGIMYRDSQRLRILLVYHVGELMMRSVAIVFREVEACRELKRLQELHHDKMAKIDCASARTALFAEYCIHCALFCYFMYMIWSLITRLEAGELGRPQLFDHELGQLDRTGLGESMPPWFFMNHQGDTNAGLLQQQRTGLLPGLNAASGNPPPFSGEPRTLEDLHPALGSAPSIQPFRGTPHRLE